MRGAVELTMVRTMSNADSPRWSVRPPRAAEVSAFLAAQERCNFGYATVGVTRDDAARALRGYNFDCNRVRLGDGEVVFEKACAALRAWRMFPAPWTRIWPGDAPIRAGQTLAMQAHALGGWWMNGCRIVYVLEENEGAARRFGFAYGTLPAHVEEGEERFSVELHADGAVWYDLRAFSRPRYWPVRLAKPLARRLQRRFVRESLAAMCAVIGATGESEGEFEARSGGRR